MYYKFILKKEPLFKRKKKYISTDVSEESKRF